MAVDNLKLLDWIEQLQESNAKLVAKVALLDFVVVHLVNRGAVDDLTASLRPHLARLLEMAETMVEQAGDPEAIEPMSDALRASLDRMQP